MAKRSKNWFFSYLAKNLLTRSHLSNKTGDQGKCLENCTFSTCMGSNSLLPGIFVPFFDECQTLTQKTTWNHKKNAGSLNFLSLLQMKFFCLKGELWQIFSFKIGQKSHFKLCNFLCTKDRRVVDPAFFVIPSFFCVKLG